MTIPRHFGTIHRHAVRMAMAFAFCTAMGGLITPARAQITNGSFETGTFSGWQTTGAAAVVSGAWANSTAGFTATDGTQQAHIYANLTDGSVTPAALETFLGLSAGSLNTNSGTTARNGSGLRQTITVTAGQRLAFDWQLLTAEDPFFPPVNPDFAFFTIRNTAFATPASYTSLAEAGDTTTATPFDGTFTAGSIEEYLTATARTTTLFTFATAGTYQIGFGVANAVTTDIQTGVTIDNVRLLAPAVAPEAGSVALMGLGIAGIGLVRARMRRKRDAGASTPC